MAGSICYHRTAKRYFVSWYHAPQKKTYKIYRYKGQYMPKALDERGRDIGHDMAVKLLSTMQGDVENGCFRIEKYTHNETDVIPYLNEWLEAIRGTISPATYKDYKNSVDNHLTPFFRAKAVMLHEIEYDTLVQLLSSIERDGKGKLNVMYCLHRCLRFAKKARRIPDVPEFPERGMYQIVEPIIRWLPSERQEAVIRAIPAEHQPIFWWLKYHLRRPSEAMALLKDDFREGVFEVQRGFSAKQPWDRTKTGEIHLVPCHSDFSPYLAIEEGKQRRHGIISPYFFVNPSSRKAGKHYTLVFLEALWNKACAQVGESISLYPGTKHSTASQLMNEHGLNKAELQVAGDWKRAESVNKYAKVEVATRKNLLEGKIKQLGSFGRKSDVQDIETKG